MMRFLKKLFLGIILNVIAIRLLSHLFNDFYFNGTLEQLIIFAFILALLNLLIKPILQLIFLPLIWITLGIFALIINIIILKTASILMPVLIIESSITWLAASIIISIFNSFSHRIK